MSSFFQQAPEGWDRVPLKFLIEGSKNGAWGGEAGTHQVDAICVRIADFDWQRLRLDLSNPTIRSFGSDQFRRLALQDGDMVLEKSGGGEKTPVGRIVMFAGAERSVTSNFVARVRPVNTVWPRFLLYLIAAQYMSGFSIQFVKQNTGIQNLDDSSLFRSDVWIPDRDTQKTIADFLDRETARIDQLIEKKQAFVTLLKEKRDSLIALATTRGIDTTVPLKSSGVDWLGRIPAHWEIVPATSLFKHSKERAREGDQLLSATQKYGVIPLVEFERREQRQVTLAVANLELRKHVEIGDFVISMRSMDGGLERAHAVGSVRSSYSVLKPGPHVEGRYYGALLKSSMYIQALRLTSNFVRDGQDMNFTHFRKVYLPKLKIKEQVVIADYIDLNNKRNDKIVEHTEQSIQKLREFRSALITTAVTGQIDVRIWGKQGKTCRHLDEIEEAMQA
ncbi:restriction endonuclease subunit S [Thalassospira sp. MCCC 1A02491]|uniref:restriction endonuclease subunit S n=1 Tax=Thalassospira sp. MCCC 1A02491 TaxID=1769751 RepID=UPI000B0EDB2A|nr:restriction endonuclease subunit S [Thalassospira sp. MCCC 1A02491]